MSKFSIFFNHLIYYWATSYIVEKALQYSSNRVWLDWKLVKSVFEKCNNFVFQKIFWACRSPEKVQKRYFFSIFGLFYFFLLDQQCASLAENLHNEKVL